MKKQLIVLGSQSYSRKLLLEEAKIPFVAESHKSSEQETVFAGDVVHYVTEVAKHKMASLVLADYDADEIFVITSDSMVQHDASGELLGKPHDVADAKRMLALASSEIGRAHV